MLRGSPSKQEPFLWDLAASGRFGLGIFPGRTGEEESLL